MCILREQTQLKNKRKGIVSGSSRLHQLADTSMCESRLIKVIQRLTNGEERVAELFEQDCPMHVLHARAARLYKRKRYKKRGVKNIHCVVKAKSLDARIIDARR